MWIKIPLLSPSTTECRGLRLDGARGEDGATGAYGASNIYIYVVSYVDIYIYIMKEFLHGNYYNTSIMVIIIIIK